MLCGWGVKAGMVRKFVAGKTVSSPCDHGPYLSTLAIVHLNSALHKYPVILTLTLPGPQAVAYLRGHWAMPSKIFWRLNVVSKGA